MISQKAASYPDLLRVSTYYGKTGVILIQRPRIYNCCRIAKRYNVVQGSHSELMDYLLFRPYQYLIFGTEY